MIWQLWGHRSVWGHIYGDTQHARGQRVTPCTWWVTFWGGEVDIITFSGVVVSISKWYSPPNVCPHQPTINTMHGQSGQARAQDWEPVYTHTMTVSPSWLRSLESRINEILLRCWQQSASWPRSYWRKIMYEGCPNKWRPRMLMVEETNRACFLPWLPSGGRVKWLEIWVLRYDWGLLLCSAPSAPQPVFTITEKAPTKTLSLLKAPTSTFTFKTQARHYGKQVLTPR